jgi:hypothetical protein
VHEVAEQDVVEQKAQARPAVWGWTEAMGWSQSDAAGLKDLGEVREEVQTPHGDW